MFIFTLIEVKALIVILKKYITWLPIGSKNIEKINVMIEKCEKMENCNFKYSISPGRQTWIETVIERFNKLSERYGGTKDMSLIFEYDEMKKECQMINNYLADLKAEFEANRDAAKADLKLYLYELAEEYMKDNPSMSNTMAEKKAEMDNRYLLIKEEYRLYIKWANLVKFKQERASSLESLLMQSVSTGRTGMVRDSYTANI